MTFNLILAPSLKVRVGWSNVAACDKSRAFCKLGLWCDLWLGSLVCSIWSFIDLRSQSRGLGKIRHSERSQKTKQRYCDGVLTDLKSSRTEEFKENSAGQKSPAFSFSGWWSVATQMNFSFFGSLGCEIKGVSRDSQFFYDHHNFITTVFQQKRHRTKMIRKHTPNQRAGECHWKDTIFSLLTSNQLRPEDLGSHVWSIRDSILRFHDTETSHKQRMQTQQQQQ